MKKLLKMGLLISTVILVTACGTDKKAENASESEGSSKEGQITAWAWDPKFNIAALELAEEFYQKDNSDFKLNIVENAQADIVPELNTSLSSGTTKGLPNLVLIEDYRAKSFLDAYPESFFPLTDFMDASEFMSYKVEATSIDGVNYAIPFDTGVTGLYLRKPIIEEAGLKVQDFQDITWTKYIELGKVVKEKTGIPMLSNDMNDLGLLRAMMQSSGSWYTTEDGATPYIKDNQSFKQGFKDFKEMLDSGVMITHNGWDQLLSNYQEGKVASVVTGNWMTPSVKAVAEQSGEWVVLPFPKQEGIKEATNASNLGGSSLYVLNIDGKEETAKFISETFGKNKDFYQELITKVGAIGSYTPAVSGEAYKASDEFFGGQKIYQDFSDWATKIPPVSFGKNTYAFEDISTPAMQDYLNGGDLDKILADTQKAAETQIK